MGWVELTSCNLGAADLPNAVEFSGASIGLRLDYCTAHFSAIRFYTDTNVIHIVALIRRMLCFNCKPAVR